MLFFSEAICENVGSRMNSHSGSSRNVEPVNFNIELSVSMNGPPVHQAGALISQAVEVKRAERRDPTKTSFISSDGGRRLKFPELGAAIGNYRDKKEEKAYLPAHLFD